MTQDQAPAPLVCEECGAETDRLYTFLWEQPRTKRCKDCHSKKEQRERIHGSGTCGKCGKVRLDCYC